MPVPIHPQILPTIQGAGAPLAAELSPQDVPSQCVGYFDIDQVGSLDYRL